MTYAYRPGQRPTPEQIEEMRADVADGRWGFVERDHPQIEDATGRLWYGTSDDAEGLRYGAWVDLSASRMADLVRRAGYAETLLAEVDALRPDLAHCEKSYVTVRTMLAESEAREKAAIARAVAAEQRAETAELAWTELHRAAVSFEAPLSEWCDGPLRDALWKALAAKATNLAEALRRELRAEGMEMGADLLSARSETEGRHEVINAPVSRGVYSIDLAEEAALLRQRAAELRGPK